MVFGLRASVDFGARSHISGGALVQASHFCGHVSSTLVVIGILELYGRP